ncbi:hypothetical protein ACM39_05735 [Chryseobacterium sp. FH2]|uniref:Crp/Fnr family transcriptional regulator n=1 Tax=Chryseobacterium sp. FH2 TaxID=1674291 RepID=UPI00065AD61E|nr:Crp/Fnr family transcriptional regulator [Chryseobacterium sp. FH2]KMQ68789.1 hypothetical protein ACM39_05735 [Chryseobacterium sp. FH2]
MIICEHLLLSQGAKLCSYDPEEYIFNEGTVAKNYFQIRCGTVKLNNYLEDGKEFIHGFPYEGHCIGESYVFTENKYAVNAVALTNCEIIVLDKNKFLQILLKEPELFLKVNKYTADRLHFRYIISGFLSISDPLVKIEKLFSYLRKYFGGQSKHSFLIPYTRQQIAALTGLRVETVIRVVKKMEIQGVVKIDNAKVYF